MAHPKNPSSYLILAIALIAISAIGIWLIVSSEFVLRDKKSNKELEESQYYYEVDEQKSPSSDEDSLEEGDEVSDFRLETIRGEFIGLEDLKGRKFLLVFFNSGCGYCKMEMKDLVELYGQRKEIIAIAIWGDEKDDLIEFARELGVDFPILIDKNDEIAAKYFVKGTPTNFLIDENGVILEKYRGYAPRIELERILGL